MGTSRANVVPNTKGFEKIAGSLRSPLRNPSSIAQLTISAASDYIPVGHVSLPFLVAAAHGIRFILDVREEGLESTLKKDAIRYSLKYIAPSVSNELWKIAQNKIDLEYAGSPYSQLTERAFKKTISTIMKKGIKSMEEEYD